MPPTPEPPRTLPPLTDTALLAALEREQYGPLWLIERERHGDMRSLLAEAYRPKGTDTK